MNPGQDGWLVGSRRDSRSRNKIRPFWNQTRSTVHGTRRQSLIKRRGIVRDAVAHGTVRFNVNYLPPVGLRIQSALVACVLGGATLQLQGKQNAYRGNGEQRQVMRLPYQSG